MLNFVQAESKITHRSPLLCPGSFKIYERKSVSILLITLIPRERILFHILGGSIYGITNGCYRSLTPGPELLVLEISVVLSSHLVAVLDQVSKALLFICTFQKQTKDLRRKFMQIIKALSLQFSATSNPVLLAILNSYLCLSCPKDYCLYLGSISLSCGLENAPRKKSGVYVTFNLFASFLSKTIALHWLLSNACKQLLYMFCLDFILFIARS